MATTGEHKTVQARILKCAQEIGWTFVPRAQAEWQRRYDPDGAAGRGECGPVRKRTL